MTSHPESSISFDLPDPYGEDEEAPAASYDETRVAQQMAALWAMLARPPLGTATTLYGHMRMSAESLAQALHLARSPLEPVALAMSRLLVQVSGGRVALTPSARGACVEAIERMLLSHSGLPGTRTSKVVEPPQVIVVSTHVRSLLPLAAILPDCGVRATPRVTGAALDLLELQPCDAVLFHDAHGVREAADFCLELRALPMHLQTPVLCLTGHPDYPLVSPLTPARGLRVASARISPAELALRLHTLLA